MALKLYTYAGYNVFGQTPNWASDPVLGLRHPNSMLAYMGLGTPWEVYGDTRHELEGEYRLSDKQEISEMVAFFDARYGRFDPFWAPSWRRDVVVTAAIGAADSSLTIADIKYSTFWMPNDVTGRYVCLVYPDGTHVCRKVTAAPAADSLTLDSAVGKACSLAELESFLCCFLYFVRFAHDEMEISYHSRTVADVKLRFREVPDEL